MNFCSFFQHELSENIPQIITNNLWTIRGYFMAIRGNNKNANPISRFPVDYILDRAPGNCRRCSCHQ